MKPDSDNIEKLIFAFEYEDKSLASKCNTIIESIFKTQIFPEIKNAIDNKIPKELTIQLESLEIDIGTINEKELPTFLAKKIIDKLDEALRYELNLKINQKSIHINESAHSQESDYSIVALEYYLKRGYFPAWFNQKISLDKILKNVIDKEQTELIQMIMKNKGNESFIKRLEFSLEPKTFKRIYSKMESMSLEEAQKLPKEDNSKLTQKLTIEDKLHQESSISEKAIDNYRLKIVIHYLEFGYLPNEFRDLNQIDVQNIFMELIQLKDSFLADKFSKSPNPKVLFNRVTLLNDDTKQDLKNYLIYYSIDADKYVLNINSDFQKNSISESAKLEIEDRKLSTYTDMSILTFYAHNGFFPWWTDATFLTELLKRILDNSRSLGESFEDICLEVEEESEFMEPMVSILPKHLIEVFSVICAQHVRLNSKWQEILSLFENKQDLKDSNNNKLISNSLSNEFEEEQHLTKNQLAKERPLQKAIYFLKDEEILNPWLKENSVIKGQVLSYLKLAPFMYYREINPSRWRELVHKFAFDYYKSIEHKPNKIFHISFLEFLEFLEKRDDNISWKKVFKMVYQRLQRVPSTNRGIFLDELLDLVGAEAEQEEVLNMELSGSNEVFLDELGAEIRVYNSGLIIFWPFLTRYFEQLSLLQNGEFLNDISRNRSVFLLQQLVYGSVDFPEHVLPLNKLLVGLTLKRHLSQIEELTNQEKELSLSLLNGLISNWDKVKNSSIEGIRETFLQREGMLSIEKDKYVLKVEKRGVDILLSSLPWSISLIKLPWMQKPLYIEWI